MIQDGATEQAFWKRCSSCKQEIPFSAPYQVCSVSTCNSKRRGLIFCSIPCWDAHLGFANHRESSAEEKRAPSKNNYIKSDGRNTLDQPTVRRKIIPSPSSQPDSTKKKTSIHNVDTLVVVSKVKGFIQNQSGYNTSQCAIDALTQRVVDECLKAIEHASESGRKTVMGRDIDIKQSKT